MEFWGAGDVDVPKRGSARTHEVVPVAAGPTAVTQLKEGHGHGSEAADL